MFLLIRRQQGFTLIEILIAMSITAIISLLTWQGFSVLLHHYKKLSQEVDTLQHLELGMTQLKKDFLQIPRVAIEPSDGFLNFEGNAHTMQFITLGEQGKLAKVSYTFYKTQLKREIQYAPWNNSSTHTLVFNHITKGHFNYIVNQRVFLQQKGLPDGIQCELDLNNKHTLSRLFLLKEISHE
ncbi:MAG: PulJ/GspJ family protein [Gammaproteobacteria bacterium]